LLFLGHRFTAAIPAVNHPWFVLTVFASPLFLAARERC
jgi:hypothetical protein